MNHPFMELWNKPSRLVVGLMSGTSADGIDAVLTRITGSGTSTQVEQLGFYFLPFDSDTRRAILEICGGEHGGTREVCLLGTHLGRLYAQAVQELLRITGTEKVDLIGNHGQSISGFAELQHGLYKVFSFAVQPCRTDDEIVSCKFFYKIHSGKLCFAIYPLWIGLVKFC